jgi:hypothetical protein
MAAPAPDEASEGLDRAEVLGAFLDAHWQLPVPAQGPAPEGWSEAEASLDPQVCGACHPKQHTEWGTSLHAGAWSPGFAGQLVEGGLADPDARASCMTCHAPLAEQLEDAELRAQGIVCASCHVRAHEHRGPPRRPELPPAAEPLPHGGFTPREEYQQARFCAPCHQFFDDAGVNGKPVENTFAEWQVSPFAEPGPGHRDCQDCHMPDRAHLWRGIHDPEMVRSGVEATLEPAGVGVSGERLEARLVLRSTAVGHAFPSYVTPRVFLELWQADAAGGEIADTREELTLARILDFGSHPWEEIQDTRISPGGAAILDYARPRAPGAAALTGRVRVDPDFHYRSVFAALKDSYTTAEARSLMRDAHRRTLQSPYTLYDLDLPL